MAKQLSAVRMEDGDLWHVRRNYHDDSQIVIEVEEGSTQLVVAEVRLSASAARDLVNKLTSNLAVPA